MIKVNVFVEDKNWKKYFKNPHIYLEKKVNILKKKTNFFKSNIFDFSILLSNSVEIRKLNKKFRNKNKSTDVLSFPFYENFFLSRLKRKKKKIYLGDIIINLNKIDKKNFEREFNKLWIHGLLHLFGHNHKKNKDYVKMLKFEKNFINLVNPND